MPETAKERFIRQLEALKKRDFEEVKKIGRGAKSKLILTSASDFFNTRQSKLAGFK
ncbi:MAG: hypothetical protein PHS93_08380 [Candidatus Omnitrophica bacterium]|nr:hypothetical protein [Candidatus Omnitrophota bacterium]MDD5353159.1 hypothetical protein [Candidatus Omnitrophota bacterium]MDD5551140.1 hypothetical protein [Candidatus Omnitrophota bacterium]